MKIVFTYCLKSAKADTVLHLRAMKATPRIVPLNLLDTDIGGAIKDIRKPLRCTA